MTITEARPDDAVVVARLFIAAFHNSARAMFGERPFRPDAMADFYSFILRTEPGCTLIAWTSGADLPAAGRRRGPLGHAGPRRASGDPQTLSYPCFFLTGRMTSVASCSGGTDDGSL